MKKGRTEQDKSFFLAATTPGNRMGIHPHYVELEPRHAADPYRRRVVPREVRSEGRENRRNNFAFFRIWSHRDQKVSVADAERLLLALVGASWVSFEIAGNSKRVSYTIVVPKYESALAFGALASTFPASLIESTEVDTLDDYRQKRETERFGTKYRLLELYPPPPLWNPIGPLCDDLTIWDPLTLVCRLIADLDETEFGVYQVLISCARRDWANASRLLLAWTIDAETRRVKVPLWAGTEMIGHREKPVIETIHPVLEEAVQDLLWKKLSLKARGNTPWFMVVVRFATFVQKEKARDTLLGFIRAFPFRADSVPFRMVQLWDLLKAGIPPKVILNALFQRASLRFGFACNTMELANLAHLPGPNLLKGEGNE